MEVHKMVLISVTLNIAFHRHQLTGSNKMQQLNIWAVSTCKYIKDRISTALWEVEDYVNNGLIMEKNLCIFTNASLETDLLQFSSIW